MIVYRFFFLMIRRPPRSTLSSSSAASDVYKRQHQDITIKEGICPPLSRTTTTSHHPLSTHNPAMDPLTHLLPPLDEITVPPLHMHHHHLPPSLSRRACINAIVHTQQLLLLMLPDYHCHRV
eukprot:TRINITY_DN9995_c0_g1_i1.p1 TRINITY_DN9995_c0_g1~~TRINITY_DN9995_c0_g1_i1.p1  ORF type:complete len:122 (+),score=24.49 TRINITY_DN9995_c0_g1_i1:57-422(+)